MWYFMENIDPSLIKNDEDKKWIISRMDQYHQGMIDSIETTQERYEAYAIQTLNKIKDIRNYVLTGFGIFITLFLGYSSLYPFEQLIFFVILIPTILITLSLFLFFNWYSSKISNCVSDLIQMIRKQEIVVQQSHGFITTRVVFLSRVSPEFLINYNVFISSMINAIFINMKNEYARLSTKYAILKDLSNELSKSSKEYADNMTLVKEWYLLLDKSLELPDMLVTFVDESLQEYLKNPDKK